MKGRRESDEMPEHLVVLIGQKAAADREDDQAVAEGHGVGAKDRIHAAAFRRPLDAQATPDAETDEADEQCEAGITKLGQDTEPDAVRGAIALEPLVPV